MRVLSMTKANPEAKYAKPNQPAWSQHEDDALRQAWAVRAQSPREFDAAFGQMIGRTCNGVLNRRVQLRLVVTDRGGCHRPRPVRLAPLQIAPGDYVTCHNGVRATRDLAWWIDHNAVYGMRRPVKVGELRMPDAADYAEMVAAMGNG